MTEYGHVRTAGGYDLASSEHGDYAHLFGRHDAPLCSREISPDREPSGALCRNCARFGRILGLVRSDEAGGEA